MDYNEMMKDYALCYGDKSRILFIEKYLYTFNAMRGKKTPFKLFPRQRVFLETLANVKNIVAIKPRQCGITTLTSAWACGQCTFADADSPETILCIGNKLDLAQQLITKIRDFLTQVPRWYWGDDYYSPDPNSEKNKKSIFIKNSQSYVELFNGCKIYCRASGPNSSRGVSSATIIIFDEAAFIGSERKGEAMATYTSAIATSSAVASDRRKIIVVSTPNGNDELYAQIYKQASCSPT